MKHCAICRKGKVVVVMDTMPREGIGYELYRCLKCGEEFLDMIQLGKLAAKYRKLRKAREIQFSKWGNSIAVRIPKEIVNEYKIKSGRQGLITKDKEGIKIIPA